jgi:flagellar biosynthesis chaperone FliJ
MKRSNLVLLIAICFSLFILSLSPSFVSSLGLNYQTISTSVKSGESFCIEDYYLFNTAEQSMSGYLTVEGDLIKFLPYYNLLEQQINKTNEKTSLQNQINNLTIRLNEKKAAGENYSLLEIQLGTLDARMQDLEDSISELDTQIQQAEKKEVIEVPGLSLEIQNQYKNDSDGLRQYLISHNLLRRATLCLKAPKIEKEIQGNCYTKYYDGQVVLISTQISNSENFGSDVAMRVSAPLSIRVRCEKSEKNLSLIIGLIVVAVIILAIIIVIIIRRIHLRKKW